MLMSYQHGSSVVLVIQDNMITLLYAHKAINHHIRLCKLRADEEKRIQ